MQQFQLELERFSLDTLRQFLLMRDQMLYRTVLEGFSCFRYNTRRNARSITVEELRSIIFETIMDKLFDEQLATMVARS